MTRDLFDHHAAVRLLVYAATVIAVLYAIGMIWGVIAHYESVILVLFLAWVIAFALQPLSVRLQRLGVPHVLAVALIYLALLAVAVGSILLAILSSRTQAMQLGTMLANLFSPGNLDALDARVTRLLQGFGVSPSDAQDFINQASTQIQTITGNLASQAIATAEAMVSGTVSLIFNATVILILSFYMMLDGGALAERLIVRLPPAWVPDVRLFQQHVDSIFGGFLRAALVISLTYAALNWVVLAALGQPTAILAALVAGMLLVVPWIGGILAIIPPALVVLLNSPSSVAFRNLVILVIALFIAQQVTMQIVAPRVIGTHVGLHPLLVFAALLIGGREAGVWGILFAPPFAAVLVAMLDTFLERWQRKSGKYPDLDASTAVDGETADAEAESQAAENTQLVELPN